jgi:dCTP deaminase
MVFLKADRVCATSYADKKGKYQDQAGLTLPMVDGLAAPSPSPSPAPSPAASAHCCGSRVPAGAH